MTTTTNDDDDNVDITKMKYYRCRPWPTKRNFGGTPLSTEWFTQGRVTISPLAPVQKKTGCPELRKTESESTYENNLRKLLT